MFFSLFTGNVVFEFVNQFHFTYGWKAATKRAAATANELYWIGREYNYLEAIIVRLPALSLLNCETREQQERIYC